VYTYCIEIADACVQKYTFFQIRLKDELNPKRQAFIIFHQIKYAVELLHNVPTYVLHIIPSLVPKSKLDSIFFKTASSTFRVHVTIAFLL
jgi:hypothetical protein